MASDRNFYRNLFIAKLPRNLTDNDLMKIFMDHHPESAKIMLDAVTGKSKGFGFVLFASEEAGKAAFDALDHQHVNAHGHSFSLRIFPSKHDGKAATEEKNALFIRNIPNTVPRMKVEEFLRNFGNLTYCSMRDDHHGGNVWVVYAEYDSVQSAANSLKNLHGKRFFRQSIPVIAKYADSDELKKERRRRRENKVQSPIEAAQGMEKAVPVVPQVAETPAAPPPDHFSSPPSHFSSFPAASTALHNSYCSCGFSNGHGDTYASERGHFSGPHSPSSTELMSDHADHLEFPYAARTGTPELGFREYGASTPVSSHSRSGSMQYRHNPYAPVTPISSARSSASSIQMSASNSQLVIPFAGGNNNNNNRNASMHFSGTEGMDSWSLFLVDKLLFSRSQPVPSIPYTAGLEPKKERKREPCRRDEFNYWRIHISVSATVFNRSLFAEPQLQTLNCITLARFQQQMQMLVMELKEEEDTIKSRVAAMSTNKKKTILIFFFVCRDGDKRSYQDLDVVVLFHAHLLIVMQLISFLISVIFPFH
eukprot:gene5962-4271_t